MYAKKLSNIGYEGADETAAQKFGAKIFRRDCDSAWNRAPRGSRRSTEWRNFVERVAMLISSVFHRQASSPAQVRGASFQPVDRSRRFQNCRERPRLIRQAKLRGDLIAYVSGISAAGKCFMKFRISFGSPSFRRLGEP